MYGGIFSDTKSDNFTGFCETNEQINNKEDITSFFFSDAEAHLDELTCEDPLPPRAIPTFLALCFMEEEWHFLPVRNSVYYEFRWALLEAWDYIDHKHKDKITKDEVRFGQFYGKWPKGTEKYANDFLKNNC